MSRLKKHQILDSFQPGFSMSITQEMRKVEHTWHDYNYIFNQLDNFWLPAARRGLTVTQTCQLWAEFDTSLLDYGLIIQKAGNRLAKLARRFGMTHGEVNCYIAETRAQNCKWQLRSERNTEGT